MMALEPDPLAMNHTRWRGGAARVRAAGALCCHRGYDQMNLMNALLGVVWGEGVLAGAPSLGLLGGGIHHPNARAYGVRLGSTMTPSEAKNGCTCASYTTARSVRGGDEECSEQQECG